MEIRTRYRADIVPKRNFFYSVDLWIIRVCRYKKIKTKYLRELYLWVFNCGKKDSVVWSDYMSASRFLSIPILALNPF